MYVRTQFSFALFQINKLPDGLIKWLEMTNIKYIEIYAKMIYYNIFRELVVIIGRVTISYGARTNLKINLDLFNTSVEKG